MKPSGFRILTLLLSLFTLIRNRMPHVALLFVSIKPSPSRWHLKEKMVKTNSLIRNFLKKQKNTAFVDVWKAMLNNDGKPKAVIFKEDELHMNEKGYAIWQKKLEPYLIN